MTNQLLIPVDGKIPNLALMKVSAWAKAKGDHVDLRYPTKAPEEVWISCIFTWNKEQALGIGSYYSDSVKDIHYGGTGFDWGVGDGKDFSQRINLPLDVELQQPDYMLYPDEDRAVGFSLRGCDRTCEFCDVWRKEGKINPAMYNPPSKWVPPNLNKVLELSNDISLPSVPKWIHDGIILDCANSGRKLSITQGYDIRCVTEEKASILAAHKPWDLNFRERRLYIAWDKMSTEKAIRRNIPILLDAGFSGREIFCYLICGFDTTFEQDYYKVKVLWEEYGVYPYIMPFNNRRDIPRLNAFRRWVNKRELFKSIKWEEYTRNPDYLEPMPIDQESLE